MPLEALALYLKLPVFALVAARLGGLLMFQPVLGALAVPVPLRVLLVLGLAALVTPVVALPAAAPDTPLTLALALGGELLVGILLGLLCAALFAGLQLGGLLIAQQSGLAFGQIVDPTNEEEDTVPGVLYVQLTLVVYLAIGGHRALVAACLDSFAHWPLAAHAPLLGSITGSPGLSGAAGAPDSGTPALQLLGDTLALATQLAFRVAGPTLLALLLVDVALGFITRTMPQLNILAVGFSIKGLLAFALMAASLPVAMDAFIETIGRVFQWATELL
ncbi:MAG: flagellar biosynthetic protein FliR [Planctomycetota bacterium]